MSKFHGYTFLTKPRWTSHDREAVEKSPAQWKEVDHDPRAGIAPDSGPWTLSLLGIINGDLMPLSWFGLCLIAQTDHSGKILRYTIGTRYW